ncbi:uncharacterized protein TNCV_3273601 [Trichonephila clavipes]|nr:uncharacterized protein TNCV_3273601 [Trichonephila clavipes]
MLVRLSRAPVLSGRLRRKTQPFSGTLYMAASSKTPSHQSKGHQKFKTLLQVPVFPGSSPLCHHTNSENPSDTTSFESVLVGDLDVKRRKGKLEWQEGGAENREGSLGFPGFVKPVFTKYINPEAVCLPGSKAAAPITQVVPVVFATVRLPDENRSPVRAGGVINGRDKISPVASPYVNPGDPVPAFSLTIPDDPVPAFL